MPQPNQMATKKVTFQTFENKKARGGKSLVS